MSLQQSVRDFFIRFGLQRTYWIAYSGGMDSHVLLSCCHEIRKELPLTLRAIHVNHHLQPFADEWAKHCQAVCRDYEIELITRDVFLQPKQGESLEELARNERYTVFAACLQADDVLLTAHHQDDQAETILLQLLRGAGLPGLAGMPAVKKIANAYHARPLLSFTREQLRQAAVGLQWIDDLSNQDINFDRNFLRQVIFPQLANRWPALTQTLARSAAHCAEAQTLLAHWALPIAGQKTLSVRELLNFSDAQQRLILREWLRVQGHPVPNTKKISNLLATVLHAREDRAPLVRWAATEVRRYGDDLYVMPALMPHNERESYEWRLEQNLNLPIGTLRAQAISDKHFAVENKVLHVRFRCGGESVAMPGGSRALKNLFQEWRVPPWLRNRIPLIYHQKELIAVVGYYMNEQFMHEAGFKIILEQ